MNISEIGSDYVRFNNGLQICWGSRVFSVSFSGAGRTNINVDWPFPKSFVSQPSLTMTTGTTEDYTYCIVLGTIYNTSRISIVSFFRDQSGSGTAIANYIAIGKWK